MEFGVVKYDNSTYTVFQEPHLDKKTGKVQAVVADSRNKPHIAYFTDIGSVDVYSIVPIKGFDDINDVITFFHIKWG